MLDLGCGSGVLAIAAARLQATPVLAIDVDPAAIEATERNATRNGLADAITIASTPLAHVNGCFDVVVANLLAPTILELRDALAAHTAPNGTLLLSGLLADRWVGTVARMGRWHVDAIAEADGWVALALSR